MTHQVFLQDVIEQYYNYVRYATRQEAGGMPLWQAMHDRDAFEEKWFTSRGITLVKSVRDGRTVGALVFEDREQFMFWMLRWSWE